MLSRLPKLEILEAFIEAARAPDLRTAADNCALSQAALARRIHAFVQFAGCPMFEKVPGGMVLTQAGRECYALLEPSYVDLKRAAASIAIPASDRTVILSVSRSLAPAWLNPRLERFRNLHPGLEVDVQTDQDASKIRSGAAHLGIFDSDVDTSGLKAEPFINMRVTPVSSPAIACFAAGCSDRFSQLSRLTMRQKPDAWHCWSRAAGVDLPESQQTCQFDDAHAMYEAAAAGLGIALGVSAMVEPRLQSGHLVALGLPIVCLPTFYNFVTPRERPLYDAAWTFAKWLHAESSRDAVGWQAQSAL